MDIGRDVLLHRPVSLECSTLFHKICGFHPASLEIARYLNQPELAIHLIRDEGMLRTALLSMAYTNASFSHEHGDIQEYHCLFFNTRGCNDCSM